MGTVTMTRRRDWEKRLMAYVDKEFGLPFKWGVRDCATFMIGCLRAMCGDFKHPEFTYRNEKEALRFAHKNPVYDFLRSTFSVEHIEPSFEQRGDIILIPQGGFECAHIVLGDDFVGAYEEQGVHRGFVKDLPMENARIIRVV